MNRTLLALVVGSALGAGITAVLQRGAPNTVLTALPRPARILSSIPANGAQTATVDSDFYRRLADAGAAELETMIRGAAAAEPSRARDLTLTILLEKYAIVDAEEAVRRAREIRVGSPAIGAVYAAWARSDPARALASLRDIERPGDAADAGAAIVEALGNDVGALERVADVLADRATDSVSPAMAPSPAMLASPFVLPGPLSALQLMADRWALLDPDRALALARDLRDERLRFTFEAAGLRALARTEPGAAIARLASADAATRQRGLLGALGELVRADPERVLSLAESLPADGRRAAVAAAIAQLATRDPLAATRYVENLPPGTDRQNMVQLVARAYGRHDADAALDWARAQPDRNLVSAVVSGVAEGDPRRALDVVLSLEAPADRIRGLQAALMRAGFASDAEAAAIADRVIALEDPSMRNLPATMLLPQWASRSPDAAMRWLLANVSAVPADAFMQIGQQIAAHDPRAATGYTTQIPPTARESWLRGVVEGYAQQDPRGAVNWLGQFRGETWYAGAAAALAMRVAQHDGSAAARLLDEADPSGTRRETAMIAGQIANAWASRDPPGAAQWALTRPTETQQSQAVSATLAVWAMSDPTAARTWTLQLPPNDLRDGALSRLLTMTAYGAPSALDPVILNAFASEASRQRAVLQAVQGLARLDQMRARAVADRYLSDPGLRAQAEQALNAERPVDFLGSQVIQSSRGSLVTMPAQATIP
jgi:hypothetical protein